MRSKACLMFLLLILPIINSMLASGAELPLTGDIRGIHDPAIIKSGAKYYIFSTGRGIPMHVSSDLKHWQRIGQVFTDTPEWAKKKIPEARDIWAPDISFHNGRYYLYYSTSLFGKNRSLVGLATNTTLDPQSPAYKWSDEGLVIETFPGRDEWNAIDANYAEAADGTPYLAIGSYWTGLKLVPLDPATGKPKSEPPKLIPLAERRVAKAVEASYIIRHGSYYYLFLSHDFCCRGVFSTYKVLVGRSKAITGPYVDAKGKRMTESGGTIVVESEKRWRGPGHNSVLQDNGKTYLVYHAYDAEVNGVQSLRIDEMNWSKDGWPSVEHPVRAKPSTPALGFWEHRSGEGAISMVRLLPDGKINEGNSASRWTLNGDTLELRWPDTNAPGGAWIDRVQISADRQTYQGKNQKGEIIRGRRVSDE